jgi:conjugative transfer signal peptidase TraF
MVVKKKYPLIISAIFIVIVTLVYSTIVINISPSIPKGIYLKTSVSPKRGSLVSLCLPNKHMKIGLENHYLIAGNGTCDGMLPLLKEIIAVPGDDVILMKDRISVNGKMYNFPTHDKDSNGNLMSAYPRGHYLNTKGYWLLGTSDSRSWDSRYWGAVPMALIKNSLLPIFTQQAQ